MFRIFWTSLIALLFTSKFTCTSGGKHSHEHSHSSDAGGLTPENLAHLEAKLSGHLFGPGDGLIYESASIAQWMYGKPPYNQPEALVNVANICDLKRTLKFVKKNNIPFRIRSGGHGYAGASMCAGDCVVIDVSLLKSYNFDATRNLWLFSAGTTLNDLAQARSFPHGICAEIGVAGHVQGGGIGFMHSKLGFTLDHLAGAWVMLSDGDIVHATKTNRYKDLLWAIRGGGGGNWGVLLLMEFDPKFSLKNYFFHYRNVPYPIRSVAAFPMVLLAAIHDFEKVYLNRKTMDPTYDYTGSLYLFPTKESFAFNMTTPARYGFLNDLEWAREKTDTAAKQRFNTYIRSVRTPQKYHVKIDSSDSVLLYNLAKFPACRFSFPIDKFNIARTRLAYGSLQKNKAFINAMVRFFAKWAPEPSVYLSFIIFPVNNQTRFYDPDTSFYRDATYSVDLYVRVRSHDAVPKGLEMVRDYETMIAPTLSTRQYINEFSPKDGLTDPAAARYDTRLYGGLEDKVYQKLRKIKKKYDPKNFFRFPGSVVPARKRVRKYRKMRNRVELMLMEKLLNISQCHVHKEYELESYEEQSSLVAAQMNSVGGRDWRVVVAVASIMCAVLIVLIGTYCLNGEEEEWESLK